MTSSSSTNYIKKLVKIVYQKQKQIETMKRALRDKHGNQVKQNLQAQIDPMIRTELENASQQLKEVSMQMMSMQQKMIALSNQLDEEISKNGTLVEEITVLRQQYQCIQQKLSQKSETVSVNEATMKKMVQQLEVYQKNELQLTQVGNKIQELLLTLKKTEEKHAFEIIKYQTQINENKVQQRKLINENKNRANELKQKTEEIDRLKVKIAELCDQAEQRNAQLSRQKQNFLKLSTQYNQLRLQHDSLNEKYSLKQGQYSLLNETLKDYEEFAFEISQYIEASYTKHCCQGKLRSSKKLIREVDNCSTRFQAAFCKMNQIQLWMDTTEEKLAKLIQQSELPNQTLEDLSIIARSFEEKLQLCDLTERIQKEKLQMDQHQQQLLDNLQKQCEKSYQRERSKLVELDEVREILKITKDINRELMDEINGKQYVISECRKIYGQLIGSKTAQEYKILKNLLNIKA